MKSKHEPFSLSRAASIAALATVPSAPVKLLDLSVGSGPGRGTGFCRNRPAMKKLPKPSPKTPWATSDSRVQARCSAEAIVGVLAVCQPIYSPTKVPSSLMMKLLGDRAQQAAITERK